MLPTSLLAALCVLLAGASAAPLEGSEVEKRALDFGADAILLKLPATTTKRRVVPAPAPTKAALLKATKAAVVKSTKVPVAAPKKTKSAAAAPKATKALSAKATKALSAKATKKRVSKTKASGAKVTRTRRAPAKAPLPTKAREEIVKTTKVRPVKTTRVPPPPPPPPSWNYEGRATWYSPCDPNQNHGYNCMGSCSNTVQDWDPVVAMNAAQYSGCGGCVEILDVERGNVARFQVADRCAGCGWGQLDLTPGALGQLGRNTGNWGDAEFPIRWRFC